MTRLAACALAGFLALAACGKYGPPVRANTAPPKKPTPALGVPVTSDSEECPDPNAVPAPAGGGVKPGVKP